MLRHATFSASGRSLASLVFGASYYKIRAYDHFSFDSRARFNDGRFRVTTEAKLRPLARFGCSMVSRLILALRASVSRLKAELQRIATSRIAESVKRTMQRTSL